MLRKILISFLFGAFLASVAFSVYLHIHYAFDMPRHPDPIAGRIFPVTVNHGYRVYVTQHEKSRLSFAENLMTFGGGLAFLLGGILVVSFRIRNKRQVGRRCQPLAGERPPTSR